MHPGWTTTEGVKKSIPGFYNFYQSKFRDIHMGTDTILYLCLEDDDKLEQVCAVQCHTFTVQYSTVQRTSRIYSFIPAHAWSWLHMVAAGISAAVCWLRVLL